MLSPSHPARYFVSYHTRKVVRSLGDNFLLNRFSKRKTTDRLTSLTCHHSLPIYRDLSGVEKYLFDNKKVNLELAIKELDGIIIKPGEVFSLWNLVGNPTQERGFLPGLIISRGRADIGIGGGLCQMANLIYWLGIHSDLDIVEKHRHSFDIFPDSDRKVPAGTGATIVYNYKDLRLKNNTTESYQMKFKIQGAALVGELLQESLLSYQYEIVERNHKFVKRDDEFFRENEVYKIKRDLNGNQLSESLISKNCLKCQYTPETI